MTKIDEAQFDQLFKKPESEHSLQETERYDPTNRSMTLCAAEPNRFTNSVHGKFDFWISKKQEFRTLVLFPLYSQAMANATSISERLSHQSAS